MASGSAGPGGTHHPYLDAAASLTSRKPKRRRDFELARAVLVEGERLFPKAADWSGHIERALDQDPAFATAPRAWSKDGIDAIRPLGGGSSTTLRFAKGRVTRFSFKPHQRETSGDFRAELAAWRLCPLIRCDFFVPYNGHIKVREADLEALYGDDAAAKRYREKHFGTLLWKTDPDEQRWLHGALEDWVPDFAIFPIEKTALWQPWVRDAEALDRPARDDLRRSHTRDSREHHRRTRQHLAARTRRALARQLSNMLVFDFLTSNWDRFSARAAYAGANCHIKEGVLVSLDNAAGFGFRERPTVQKRLDLVQRFSRQTIRAVRALEREPTRKRLFGKRSRFARRSMKRFWRQRRALLAHVDALVAKHGEETVLFFD